MRILNYIYISTILLSTCAYPGHGIIESACQWVNQQSPATQASSALALSYGVAKAVEAHGPGGAGWSPFNMRNVVAAGVAAGAGYLANNSFGQDAGIAAATVCGIGVKSILDYLYKGKKYITITKNPENDSLYTVNYKIQYNKPLERRNTQEAFTCNDKFWFDWYIDQNCPEIRHQLSEQASNSQYHIERAYTQYVPFF